VAAARSPHEHSARDLAPGDPRACARVRVLRGRRNQRNLPKLQGDTCAIGDAKTAQADRWVGRMAG